jgi:uncharacterized protein (TIGR04552 family)
MPSQSNLPYPNSIAEYELKLQDIEQMRLILDGNSVLDWQRMAFESEVEVNRLLFLAGIDTNNESDLRQLNEIYTQAIDYLDNYIHYYVSDEIRQLDDARALFQLVSYDNPLRKDSCILLKVMHVVHHVTGRDLLYLMPMPASELFHRVETRVFEALDGMKKQGIKIAQFEGSRKTQSSILTKLLCRKDSLAAEVHDRIRFRVITEGIDDLFDAVIYLSRNLFPFNYVLPGESRNDLIDLEGTLDSDTALTDLKDQLQPLPNANKPNNPYSAKGFKMINFVVDLPVRVDDLIPSIENYQERLGKTIFLLVEFQLVDRETHINNSSGENQHSFYKARQIQKVKERLMVDRDQLKS